MNPKADKRVWYSPKVLALLRKNMPPGGFARIEAARHRDLLRRGYSHLQKVKWADERS